ncbi:hypothetical protein WKT22_01188 [Candidatus Lokiarchaeum ossiferum]
MISMLVRTRERIYLIEHAILLYLVNVIMSEEEIIRFENRLIRIQAELDYLKKQREILLNS